MTTTWIVGVDGSADARHAAMWAVDQAIGRDVRIVLLATWTIPLGTTGMLPGAVVLPDWHEFETELLHSTERLAAELSGDGVTVEARIAEGPAAHVLIEASRSADMLVVGARGLGRVKGLLLGSVSQRCASHGVVPTAVIGHDVALGPARRVLVGYDGSAHAQAAARWALGFADPTASVTMLDALGVAPWLTPDLVRERFPSEVQAAEAEFRAHMAEIDPDGRAAHSFVIGDPRLCLLEACQDADLLVMGARGRGALGAVLLGSTTTWMLHGATRAIVVVPSRSIDEG